MNEVCNAYILPTISFMFVGHDQNKTLCINIWTFIDCINGFKFQSIILNEPLDKVAEKNNWTYY